MVNFQVGGQEQIEKLGELAFYRGNAINAYASLESSLWNVFSYLGDIPKEVAGIIFFKITNARSRNEIISKLKKKKHGSTHNLFWNSIMKEVGYLDEFRNRIVHWHSVTKVGGDSNALKVEAVLAPGNFTVPGMSEMTILEMGTFIERCDIFSRALNLLFLHWTRPEAPLHDIFQKSLTYPLPPGHQLSRTPTAPDSPPQSSEV